MQTKSLFLENIIVRLIQVYVNNIVFTLKIRLCLYKIAINYLSSPYFMLFFFVSIRSLAFFIFFLFSYI